MARMGPTTLTLPPFAGATRRLVLWNVAAFFVLAVLQMISSSAASFALVHLGLNPAALMHGEVWQLVSYSFLNTGLISTLFAMLTIWFIGDMLESSFGPRWFYELYFASAMGGAVLASAIAFTHVFRLQPDHAFATGPYAGIFGMLLAVAVLFGDQEFLLLFAVRIKARYLVAIYILVELAILLTSADAFNALIQLCGGLCGYLFIRYAPRRGFAFSFTERYFALRNQYYRAKRRQATKKFEVYMGKQGRQVRFDDEGKYIAPDDKDPNDKRWMN